MEQGSLRPAKGRKSGRRERKESNEAGNTRQAWKKNDHWESTMVLIWKRTNDTDIYFMVCLMRDGEKGI